MILEWRRLGKWAAHLFINGKQACNTPHDNFEGHAEEHVLTPDEISSHGVPFGRVCARCKKKHTSIFDKTP